MLPVGLYIAIMSEVLACAPGSEHTCAVTPLRSAVLSFLENKCKNLQRALHRAHSDVERLLKYFRIWTTEEVGNDLGSIYFWCWTWCLVEACYTIRRISLSLVRLVLRTFPRRANTLSTTLKLRSGYIFFNQKVQYLVSRLIYNEACNTITWWASKQKSMPYYFAASHETNL